jgi:hypothetical protein
LVAAKAHFFSSSSAKRQLYSRGELGRPNCRRHQRQRRSEQTPRDHRATDQLHACG